MKKTVIGMAGVFILLSGSVAMANQAQIITDEFYSVGNEYDLFGNNLGGFNAASQNLGVKTYQTPDGQIDSSALGRLLRIRDLDNNVDLFSNTNAAGEEMTFVLSGVDDVLWNPGADSATLYSLGLNIKLYSDTPGNFDATNPATASDGTLVLDMKGHTQTVSATAGFDTTLGTTYDLKENFDYGTGRYTGSAILDVIGGSWATLWDTNMENDGSDLAFSFSLDEINTTVGQFDLSGTANGVGNPVPEPATMLLFGAGLIGLAGVSRRKLRK